MWRLSIGLAISLLTPGGASAQKLELRGQVEQQPAPATVILYGSTFPFNARTLSDGKGRFRFKDLDPGAYTVSVFVPGRGEVRQTVEVSRSLADAEGRVGVTIAFIPSPDSLEASATVSIGELTIPPKAQREYRRAQQRLSERDEPGAIRHLEQAVKIAPGFVAAWNNLGTIAYQTRRYADAEKYFRTALEHEPGAYSPVVNLGGTLLSLGRYAEALKYNDYALQQRPRDALANSQMGLTHYFLGNEELAIRYLTEAKRLDPAHFSHPQITLARIHAGRGDLPRAIAELEDFLNRHPDAPNAGPLRTWMEQLRQAPGANRPLEVKPRKR